MPLTCSSGSWVSNSRTNSRSRCRVRARAMSCLALRISLGVSSRSVADWKRSWNRCLIVSLSVSRRCSSLISRNWAGFIVASLSRGASDPGLPRDEAALEGHLVGDTGQAVAGGSFGQSADLEQDHAGTNHGGPVFRLALALAHAGFQRNRRHGFVREDANVEAALTADRVRRGDTPGLDR